MHVPRYASDFLFAGHAQETAQPADTLCRSMPISSRTSGSTTRQKVRSQHARLTEKVTRRQVNLGRADDPDVAARADRIRRKTGAGMQLRTTVTALKAAHVPAPSRPLGRVPQAVASAGLSDRGMILVGTAAFQTYSCTLGSFLPSPAIMTNDVDLLVASFDAPDEMLDLEKILQRADPTFKAVMSNTDQLPKVFRASNAFQVGVLTQYRRGRKSPIAVEASECSAEALKFMEHLAADPISSVALYGSGVPINVPPPARYAVHRLLIAPENSARHSAKSRAASSQ